MGPGIQIATPRGTVALRRRLHHGDADTWVATAINVRRLLAYLA